MALKKLFNFVSMTVGRRSVFVLFAVSLLCVLIQSATVIVPFFIEHFINDIQTGNFSVRILYAAGLFYVLTFALGNLVTFFYGKIQIGIKNKIQVNLVRSILSRNPLYIRTKGEGFFAKLMESSLEVVMNFFAPYNLRNFFLIIQNCVIVGILFYKNQLVGIFCAVLFLLYFFAYLLNNKLFSTILMNFIEKSSSSTALIYDFIRGNKSLFASEQSLKFAERKILKVLATVRKIEFRLNFFFDLIFTSVGNLFRPCLNIVIVAILGKSVLEGSVSFGTFVLVITYYNLLQSGMNSFQGISDSIFHTAGALNSLSLFFGENTTFSKKPLEADSKEFFYSIDSVSLSLNENCILKNASLKIGENFHYALVGQSGLGKSSLVNLLLGLQSPQNGAVHFLSGKNDVSSVHVFEDVAWFSQNPDIFNLTLKENIFLGDKIDESEYAEFVKILELEKLDGRLLGSGGENISGGERQRVGLARFLHQLKSKNHYFIDEGFVSLDEFTKQKMLLVTKKSLCGKTGICITHDDAVFQSLCDKVILYDKNGTISLLEKPEGKPLKDFIAAE